MVAPPDSLSPRQERLRAWLDTPTSSGPSVTFDGASVLFISDRSGLPQVWKVPSEGGAPVALMAGSERADAVRASPGGPWAVVCVDEGGNERWQIHRIDLHAPAGAKVASLPTRDLTRSPQHHHLTGVWRDERTFLYSSNVRDPRFFDVFALDIEKGPAGPPVFEKDEWNVAAAARDDRVVVAENTSNLNTQLHLLSDGMSTHLNPHGGEHTVRDVDLGFDGVYAASTVGREFAALVRYRRTGGSHEFLRQYPHDIEVLRADPRGHRLAYTVNVDGWSEVHVLDLDTAEDRAFSSGPKGVVTQISWFPDGERFAYDLSSMEEGTDIYVRAVASGKEKRLTRAASPLPAIPSRPSLGRLKAEDGLALTYWEFSPVQGPPIGTLLWLHGGPEAQFRPSFNPVLGFFLQEGWRVVAPNVRGSSGYGSKFLHLDDVDKRMDSVRDVRDVAKALERSGRATPGRTGVMGGSYGGFLVLSSLCTYPEMWGAGVDIVGIANFVTFLEKTGAYRRKLREVEYGSLEKDRDLLVKISPLTHVDQIVAPLLVIHGANDPRVPLFEAEQVVGSLRGRQRPVELLTFSNEGHGLVRRENRIVAYARAAEFLREHLVDAPRAPAAAPGAASGRASRASDRRGRDGGARSGA